MKDKKLIYQSIGDMADDMMLYIGREIDRCRVNSELLLDPIYAVSHAEYEDTKVVGIFINSEVSRGVGTAIRVWFTVTFDDYGKTNTMNQIDMTDYDGVTSDMCKDVTQGVGTKEMENITAMFEIYYARMNTMFGERFIPMSDNDALKMTMNGVDRSTLPNGDVDYKRMRTQKLYMINETLPNIPEIKVNTIDTPTCKPDTTDFISSEMLFDDVDYQSVDDMYARWCNYLNDNADFIGNIMPDMMHRFMRSVITDCPTASTESVWVDIVDKVYVEIGVKITGLPYNDSLTELAAALKKVTKKLKVKKHIEMFPDDGVEYMDDDTTVYLSVIRFKANKFLIKKIFKNGGQESLFA